MAESDNDDGGLPIQRSLPSSSPHISFLAAQSLGLKPKDWPAFLATQSSLLDLHSSNKVAFTGQGKGLISRKGLNKLQKNGSQKISPSPHDSAAAGLSGRQPKIPELAHDEATRKMKRRLVFNALGHPRPLVPKRPLRRGRSSDVLFLLKMKLTSLGLLMVSFFLP